MITNPLTGRQVKADGIVANNLIDKLIKKEIVMSEKDITTLIRNGHPYLVVLQTGKKTVTIKDPTPNIKPIKKIAGPVKNNNNKLSGFVFGLDNIDNSNNNKKDYARNIVKPKYSSPVPTIDISLSTKVADKAYLEKLKNTIDNLESKGYNISKFEADIADDAFVKRVVDAHKKALQSKIITYKKLGMLKWDTPGMDDMISKMHRNIQTKLNVAQTNVNIMDDMRHALMTILYDQDNGIATIRGASRENVRINMIKLIYTFIKVPDMFFKGFINFMVTGPAGSGKTKIAGVLGNIMKHLGILATQNVIMATRQNLIGEFIGQTAAKTHKLLVSALEGALFIDEAYTLTRCPTETQKLDVFADEAIGELINFMDKFIGCFVIIVAGYKQKMYECFIPYNEGIARRFPRTIDLSDYNGTDMYDLFYGFMADTLDIKTFLTVKQLGLIKSIIIELTKKNLFTNQAGDMLNLSKMIGEDAILYGSDLNDDLIKLAFRKFCASKQIALEF
jgi:hypothetical protein